MNTTLSLEQENQILRLQNQKLEESVKLLSEQLEWMKRKLFGKSSERFVADPADSLYLPGLGPETAIIPVEEEVEIPAHKKRKAKSTPINIITYPDDLPIETQVLDLREEEKIDKETGAPLVCIGEDISKKLGFKTGSYFIKVIIRKKYALAQNPDFGIKTPELPDSIISRCSVDESFLADVIVKKFCDHLPLYRQAEIRTRDEVYVSRQTLSAYVLRIAMALKPLYLCLVKAVKDSGNVFVDETPVDVLAPGKGKTDQGYMMVLLGGRSLDPVLRIYHFISSRGHDEVMEILKDYKGVFHSDKYQAVRHEAA